MNKEKLIRVIPYIVLVVGIVLVLSSFIVVQGIENQCNEHWGQQFIDYQKERNPLGDYVPGENASIEGPLVFG